MQHEEFTSLSKVVTTAQYYAEVIESKYIEMDVDKEAFVAQWLADNKTHLVKAHEFDIERATKTMGLNICNLGELERLREECEQKHAHVERLKGELDRANGHRDSMTQASEGLRAEIARLQAVERGAEVHMNQIATLEYEIIMLKARLFDMMESRNA